METIKNAYFEGERPLYATHNLTLDHVEIGLGESSLKETSNITARNCRFGGKYVFWETNGFLAENCYFAETARSSVWYSRHCTLRDCQVDAPKMFRRASHIQVQRCQFPNGLETFWDCHDVCLEDVEIKNCDYLFMHTTDIRIDRYKQDGNYSFQYAKNVEIHDAVINSKDAFWECEDVAVFDSEINGEYLGWYAKNLRLVRCHITGEQPLCYCDNLVLEDCTFGADANLALEYSTVEATLHGHVVSIKNPTTGHVTVDSLGEYIIDENQKSPADCKLTVLKEKA